MDIATALGYAAEVQPPNGQPVTEYMTDRWAQRVRADLERVVREAKAEAWDEATASAYLHETEHHIGIRHDANPYRD
jgi:hypothetical protein